MAHSTAPQLFSTTGRPETLACGNHCDCTLTEPALRATAAGCRWVLGSPPAQACGRGSGVKMACVLPILNWPSHGNFSPWRRAC